MQTFQKHNEENSPFSCPPVTRKTTPLPSNSIFSQRQLPSKICKLVFTRKHSFGSLFASQNPHTLSFSWVLATQDDYHLFKGKKTLYFFAAHLEQLITLKHSSASWRSLHYLLPCAVFFSLMKHAEPPAEKNVQLSRNLPSCRLVPFMHLSSCNLLLRWPHQLIHFNLYSPLTLNPYPASPPSIYPKDYSILCSSPSFLCSFSAHQSLARQLL